MARRVVRDASEAEDVADEAIARLTTEIQAGNRIDNIPAWLSRTALRVAVDRARAWVRRNRPEWLSIAASRASEVGKALERTEVQERVWRHLLELPARQREVLVLHQMEGLSYREIADLLDVSESTARVHGHAGREALRQKLKTK